MSATPKPRLTHFGLACRDIDRMAAFYTKVMGLTITDRGERIVFMSSDPEEHHQFVLARGRPDDEAFNPIQQMSFLVADLDELRTLYERIVADGRKIESVITHGNAWSVYFLDPEDNRAEVYCHTPWHIPQPHGHPIDLSQSNEEIARATEAHCREYDGFMSAEARAAVMAKMMGLDG